MTDGLVVWLRTQLDEDERGAYAVADHRKRAGELRWAEVDPDREPGLIGDDLGNVVTFGGAGGPSRWHAAHIARHDPARVLAEVDAKRRILDAGMPTSEHEAEGEYLHFGDWYSCSDQCPGIAWYEIVKLLALAYADREGYRDEWRP